VRHRHEIPPSCHGFRHPPWIPPGSCHGFPSWILPWIPSTGRQWWAVLGFDHPHVCVRGTTITLTLTLTLTSILTLQRHLGINNKTRSDGLHLPYHRGFDQVGRIIPFSNHWACDESGRHGARFSTWIYPRGMPSVTRTAALQAEQKRETQLPVHTVNCVQTLKALAKTRSPKRGRCPKKQFVRRSRSVKTEMF
jgi:hypothetical protein